MKKDEAIAALKEQIHNIRLVRRINPFGATFEKWRRNTRVVLENAFPNSRSHVDEFMDIQYDLSVAGPSTTNDEHNAAYFRGLESAEVLIESFIEEIEKYWKEQDSAQETSTEVIMDRKYMLQAISEAAKCQGEDNRIHPKVGVLVVKNGEVLSSAFRGEIDSGEHAEFTALEKKLSTQSVAGATVYTTLEPCTTRNHPKIPCANRLIERKIARVVIGMLDPNQQICGKGLRRLREANITTDLFPSDLMAQVEEQNREFIREYQQTSNLSELITVQDVYVERSSDPKITYKSKLRIVLRNDTGQDIKVTDRRWVPGPGDVPMQAPPVSRLEEVEGPDGWERDDWQKEVAPVVRVPVSRAFRVWIGLDPMVSDVEIRRRHETKRLGVLVLQIRINGHDVRIERRL
jgi:pyrimidine deaminase RibD-like protein